MTAIVLTLVTSMTVSSKNSRSGQYEPDFAFPKTVAENARKQLDKAVKSQDGALTLRAAIDLSLAKAMIDADNLLEVISDIQRVTAAEKDPATKALLNALMAEVYRDIYFSDRYKYDQRSLPPTPLPEDFNEWSGAQFKARINGLIDASLADAPLLQQTPLKNYASIIKANDWTFKFYPTLYDFLAKQAIDLLSDIGESRLLPVAWLCRYDIYQQLKFNYTSAETAKILSLYQSLLDFHKGDEAPFIHADIDRINFIYGCTFDPSDYDDQQYDKDGNIIKNPVTPLDLRNQLLDDLYRRHLDSPYANEALIEKVAGVYTADYYAEAQKAIARHPRYFRNCLLEAYIKSCERPEIDVFANQYVIPGDKLSLFVSGTNLDRYKIGIFRVPYTLEHNRSYYYTHSPSDKAVLVKTLTEQTGGKVPFTVRDTLEVTFDQPGCYVIVPTIGDNEPTLKDNRNYQMIRCTSLGISTGSFGLSQWAWVINPYTGAPVDKATLLLKNSQSKTLSFTTDADGRVDLSNIPYKDDYNWLLNWSLYARKGNDIYANREDIYRNHSSSDDGDMGAQLYTALTIYHPGDTVKWSAVTYSFKDNKHHLLPAGQKFTATLRDANYQEKGSMNVVTDRWGRIEGQFELPADGLTGYYSITLSSGEENELNARTRFMVSDYKLPTYRIEITDIKRNTPAQGAVTVKGKVSTYSGFALAGISIDADLSVRQRYPWWASTTRPFYSSTVTTADDGTFSIEYPAELLAQSPIEHALFALRLTATNATGENQTASTRFTQGAAYNISLENSGDYTDIDISTPVVFNTSLCDLMGDTVSLPISYKIIRHDSIIVKSGKIPAGKASIDLSDLESGVYDIRLMLDSIDLARPLTLEDVALYRPSDNRPPYDTPMWIPQEEYSVDNRRVSILYGTSAPENHIRYTVWSDSTVYRQGWLHVKAGLHRYDVKLPEGVDRLHVSFAAISGYKSVGKTVSIIYTPALRDIEVKAESFRDKITPGNDEKWTFRVVDHKGNGLQAAMMVGMYAKALDKIAQRNIWSLPLLSGSSNAYSFSYDNWSAQLSSSARIPFKDGTDDCPSIISPIFNTYGQSFTSSRNSIMLNFSGSSRGIYASPQAVKEDKLMLRAQSKQANDMLGDESLALSEVVVTTTGVDNKPDDKQFSYREAELPLALFRPMLVTDADGQMTLSFTAPNANTTWAFTAMAFTPDVLSSTFTRDVLSNKPIMVQPNMPRFLRTGDEAIIMASVMNNSDTLQSVTTTVEIFDPTTGKAITCSTRTDTIPVGKSVEVSTPVKAPFDMPLIGYRIKSAGNSFADGEQSLVPVLPSSQPVIDTKPFYISPDSTHLSLTLPKMPSEARVTLQFCENPAWYCVTALPGLRQGDMRTSMSAAAAIFSAAVAEGLLRDNPAIASALRQWENSDKSDSTLVSMLGRNQDLKLTLLNATPWMMDARSDTERMQRLALLFDKKLINATYDKAVKLLARLQRGKGGWAWIAEDERYSPWATFNILGNLGRLKQLGYLPDNKDLDTMIDNAVKWLDEVHAKDFRKNPKGDYTLYVLIRDYFKDIKQSTAASRVTKATVQRLISDWRDRDAAGKAIAAMILNDNGYNASAKKILQSLREYSTFSPEKGRYWPSLDGMTQWSMDKVGATSLILDAFNAIEPSSSDIDQIRQWLILQKEAKDWGSSVTTSDVIASILTSGSKWTRPAANATVALDGSLISPSDVETTLGYFRTSISDRKPSESLLTIDKIVGTPSWGAVYCQYTGQMSDIRPTSCDAVAIEKRLYIQRGTAWVEADSFKVGDRVRVDIVIKSTRDMDYVAIIDNRAACFEPVEQTPKPICTEGIYFYRENRDAATDIFVSHLPKGTYRLSYELFVNNAGRFASGIASLQSQYAPSLSAHSGGTIITSSAK